MATAVVMPRLGWTMESGQVVEWLKREGERVEAGEILMLVESDKAINEVEALESGVLRFPPEAPGIGDTVAIGTVLAYLTVPGEALPAADHDLSPKEVVAAGAAGAAAGQVAPMRERRRGPVASPRARRVARELGVSWEALSGSGISGRVLERDVRAAVPAVVAAPPPQRQSSPAAGAVLGNGAAVRTATRRTIAERMLASAQQTAPVTLTTEADATELARLRGQLATDLAGTEQRVPAYHDFILRLTALALREHPALNASLLDGEVVEHEVVHIGLAVETPRGLLVPVVRDVPGKSVQQLATESAGLIGAAQAGTLAGEAMRGGTFTISNLGMFGIDAFTPLINPPECAILGLGRIVARPVVTDEVNETIAVRRMMALSLTFDHRLVDGGPAARFLQRIVQLIERPLLWLTR
jgi:pyruvate dehydrogenase E2 component (dihydrolipoamide acetyltransferase)